MTNISRNDRIRGDFTAGGYGISTLAREYNLSESRIRQILAEKPKKKKTPTHGVDKVQVQSNYEGEWTSIKIPGMPSLEVRGKPQEVYDKIFEMFSTPVDKLHDYLEENPITDIQAERVMAYLKTGRTLVTQTARETFAPEEVESGRIEGVNFGSARD